MRIGFTGTSRGLTEAQSKRLGLELVALGLGELHHGDCVGGDATAHDIAVELGWRIVGHPPDNPSKRAFRLRPSDEVWEQKPYLERNRDIVKATDRLVACPGGFSEELRSGTWATIRYARKCGRTVLIIWPNGNIDAIFSL